MTPEQIIAMARDAFNCAFTNLPAPSSRIERFARMVRNQALEDAALCAEDTDNVEAKSSMSYYAQLGDASATKYSISAAIRNMKDEP